ncbi:hypothetical protein BOTBODRAFT_33064 [Botryobasidium botryosum FD-172 SS1]|uniref:Uncharacterized protein n=1 Tax=Botryobasidium botryosum (strain FD-172 SS1) TaxID=930990 RepID=A0A067MDW6_BOTB1|nr:hypothetical protein BOTBODRAFT_33064 [Botryobasidium botryosum FD-172 SS1]
MSDAEAELADVDVPPPRKKRYTYKSYSESLKSVHLPSAALPSTFDEELSDTSSHFHNNLQHLRQLNLSPSFISFGNRVGGRCASMPLLLHNWREIAQEWMEAVDSSKKDGAGDGYKPLLELMQAFIHDLRSTITPLYSAILQKLLALLRLSLPPETLTALLAALSSIFKYVFIPALSNLESGVGLEETWGGIRDSIRVSGDEVRRMLSEVWGAVVRRMKGSSVPGERGLREELLLIMTKEPEAGEYEAAVLEDCVARTLVAACKAPSRSLHPCISNILTLLLSRYLATPETSPQTYTLLRRLLTSLAHHTASPETYAPISNAILLAFEEEIQLWDREEDAERLGRTLRLVALVCSLRKGGCMSQTQLSTILSALSNLPHTFAPEMKNGVVLNITTAAVAAGDMALWMGKGRRCVEWAWEDVNFGLRLTGALSELNWGGWRMMALPLILKHTPSLLASHPTELLRLLAALQEQGRLDDADEAWRARIGEWIKTRLDSWTRSEERVGELSRILALLPILPPASIRSGLIRVITDVLATPNPVEDYARGPGNAGWALGQSLKTLAAVGGIAENDGVDMLEWVERAVEGWAWNAGVLEGLVVIAESKPRSTKLPYNALHPLLLPCSGHHSHALRLAALRLLASPLIQRSALQGEVLKRCLAAEEVSIDVQGSKERVLKIGRVGGAVTGTGGDADTDEGVELASRWLISQLKVNLRPLWTPTCEALGALSKRFPEKVWELVFAEVQKAAKGDVALLGASLPEWDVPSDAGDGDGGMEVESEKTWRCPNVARVSRAADAWAGDGVDAANALLVKAQLPDGRLDIRNYEAQLLRTLCENPSLAEKRSRTFVPFFLEITTPTLLPRPRLTSYLTLFSKFSNPKALYLTASLQELYTSLLSTPDKPLQSLALSCVLSYKSPHLMPYEDTIRMLLDETKWREQLSLLDMGAIEAKDRHEVVPMLIRLLYGSMGERKGRGRGADRKTAILGALAGCDEEELGVLVELMLEPFGGIAKFAGLELGRSGDGDADARFKFEFRGVGGTSEKQQVGYVTLLEAVIKNLGTRLARYWPALLGNTLELLNNAQRRIGGEKSEGDDALRDGYDEEEDNGAAEEDEQYHPSKALRVVRQAGLKRLAEFFRSPVPFDFAPYMPSAFASFISPRLAALDAENTQAPSALLELFYVWAGKRETCTFLVDFDSRVLPKVYACLTAANVKPSVITKTFDLIDRVLGLAAEDETLAERVVRPHVAVLLANLSTLVQRSAGSSAALGDLAQRQISVLSSLAPYIADSPQAVRLLELLSPLLRKPYKEVSEKVKVNLLQIVRSLFPLVPDLKDRESAVYRKTYDLLALLFQVLRSRPARLALVSAFEHLASCDPGLGPLSELMVSLNSYSAKRLDEPDFDRRLAAFTELNETTYKTLTVREWLPVLYNMLHFIQDPEELAVRGNAAYTFRRYVDVLSTTRAPELEALFTRTLYPGLRNGLRSKAELVRAEVLGVIAYAVKECEFIQALSEMHPLLAAGDEEANFFNNIFHIQIHRRTRALRRLVEHCQEGRIRSDTLSQMFVPLVSHFIRGAGTTDHHLVNEAVTTTGQLAGHLSWGAYNALVQQYLKLSKEKDANQRVYIRCVVAILNGFHFPMDQNVAQEESQTTLDDQDGENIADDLPVQTDVLSAKQVTRISDAVLSRLLPSLLQFLEKRDENEDTIRIPVSIGIVKVALHLPEASRTPQITKLITVLSQTLRSKSSETRDLARDTFCKIAVHLGPSYLALIMKELRGALLRGPQLHVLAFVAHAILVHVTSSDHVSTFNNLDMCVEDVAHVSAEVIFGQSGRDVQAEEFRTKMREVRGSSSKGLDSFMILAKHISPPKISTLLHPIRSIMHETEALKTMQQVDDVLRRVASGLNANEQLAPPDLLVLCHTLISQNAKFLQQEPRSSKKLHGKALGDFAVKMKRTRAAETDHYVTNSAKFVAFGLDLFITAYRRGRFNFQEASIISRLEPMVSVIGNTLYSSNSDVVGLGLKASAAIVKCPLKSVDSSLPVFIRQTLDIIRQAGSTEPSIVQTAFKSLAVILRDCPGAQVKEKDLTFLLELLIPDLEESERQGAVFTLLRAIVSRKFVVPEIYDIMEKVAEIMVTNQSSQVQEQCRGVVLQFLLDYPQGKGRLRKQMVFLAKNLSYVFESGRKSVMELLSAIFAKFDVSLLREHTDIFFMALVMVLANDDSSKCREMAGELIKGLLKCLDSAQYKTMMSRLHTWATQHEQPQLARVATQVYGLVIDVLGQEAKPSAPTILEDLNEGIKESAKKLRELDDSEDDAATDLGWHYPYQVLSSLTKLVRLLPELVTDHGKIHWGDVVEHLLFPHAWVRTAACRLTGMLFTAVPVAVPDPDSPADYPLSTSGMTEVARKHCQQLKSDKLDAALSLQIVKNLFYIGKCFSLRPTVVDAAKDPADPGAADEDDHEGEVAEQDDAEHAQENPLAWLFSKLSYQVRSSHLARRNRVAGADNWSQQPLAIFRWFAAMTSHLDSEALEAFLMHILSPVYRIMDDDTIRDAQMDELKALAQELQSLVQTKVGTTSFSNVYNRIKQSVLAVRRERKTARALQATSHPERSAKRKMQRNVSKKDNRKRKNQAFVEGKIRNDYQKRRRTEQ